MGDGKRDAVQERSAAAATSEDRNREAMFSFGMRDLLVVVVVVVTTMWGVSNMSTSCFIPILGTLRIDTTMRTVQPKMGEDLRRRRTEIRHLVRLKED
ncbi:hypothetical protein LY76DRAFT_300603 [Colletotrichum caudatum]|nr:hypothetical protein LY76DRAFT_300603 [Colletotrichum caudatum]